MNNLLLLNVWNENSSFARGIPCCPVLGYVKHPPITATDVQAWVRLVKYRAAGNSPKLALT